VRSQTRTLRVLTLTPFYPNRENAAEGCFISDVLPRTQRLGISNAVIAVRPRHRGRVHPLESQISCAWQQYFSFPGNLGLPTAGGSLAHSLADRVQQIHQTDAIDMIHAHAALPCGDAAERLSRKFGIPFVVSVHGLDVFFERQAGKTLGRWCRGVSERVYLRARAVICISAKVRECIGSAASNARVIHNGVDAETFSCAPEQKNPLIVLSVGNLIPTKGHALLLRAYSQAIGMATEWELQIIGDGPERSSLVHLARQLGIASRVRFLGKQTREQVLQAMKRCAVFALPSGYEGLGCVYLESMSCGKPAIACEGQGIDEIIEQGANGLLVQAGSELQLAESLRVLMQNEDLRARLGRAARQTVLQRHTLEHQAAELAELYRRCLA
jgi:glycosyltransferase involved in cell wall biosynthesis